MATVTICSDFRAPKNKVSHCFYCFSVYLPWSDGTGYYDLSFWMLSFKPAFSLSSFIFIKRLFRLILKEISSEYSLECLMLNLKFQYFSHLLGRIDSLEKILMLQKIEGRRRTGLQRMRWLDSITIHVHEFEQAPGVGNGHGRLVCHNSWGHKE